MYLARRICQGPCEEPDESESVALVTETGYSVGGTQARESRESCSSSSRAAGLFDLAALQHNRTNPQRVSEKPKDSA